MDETKENVLMGVIITGMFGLIMSIAGIVENAKELWWTGVSLLIIGLYIGIIYLIVKK